jgi:RasGEF domain/PH domain
MLSDVKKSRSTTAGSASDRSERDCSDFAVGTRLFPTVKKCLIRLRYPGQGLSSLADTRLDAVRRDADDLRCAVNEYLRDVLGAPDASIGGCVRAFLDPRFDPFEYLEVPYRVGHLTKRGQLRKSWKRRWFILKDAFLFYFDGPVERTLLGSVCLRGATMSSSPAASVAAAVATAAASSRAVEQQSSGGLMPYTFSIKTADEQRQLLCAADSEADMADWMRDIAAAIDRVSKPIDSIPHVLLSPASAGAPTAIDRAVPDAMADVLASKKRAAAAASETVRSIDGGALVAAVVPTEQRDDGDALLSDRSEWLSSWSWKSMCDTIPRRANCRSRSVTDNSTSNTLLDGYLTLVPPNLNESRRSNDRSGQDDGDDGDDGEVPVDQRVIAGDGVRRRWTRSAAAFTTSSSDRPARRWVQLRDDGNVVYFREHGDRVPIGLIPLCQASVSSTTSSAAVIGAAVQPGKELLPGFMIMTASDRVYSLLVEPPPRSSSPAAAAAAIAAGDASSHTDASCVALRDRWLATIESVIKRANNLLACDDRTIADLTMSHSSRLLQRYVRGDSAMAALSSRPTTMSFASTSFRLSLTTSSPSLSSAGAAGAAKKPHGKSKSHTLGLFMSHRLLNGPPPQLKKSSLSSSSPIGGSAEWQRSQMGIKKSASRDGSIGRGLRAAADHRRRYSVGAADDVVKKSSDDDEDDGSQSDDGESFIPKSQPWGLSGDADLGRQSFSPVDPTAHFVRHRRGSSSSSSDGDDDDDGHGTDDDDDDGDDEDPMQSIRESSTRTISPLKSASSASTSVATSASPTGGKKKLRLPRFRYKQLKLPSLGSASPPSSPPSQAPSSSNVVATRVNVHALMPPTPAQFKRQSNRGRRERKKALKRKKELNGGVRIRFGNVDTLIQALWTEDEEYARTIIFTHTTFMSSRSLFQFLTRQYTTRRVTSASVASSNEDFIQAIMYNRARVCAIVHLWIAMDLLPEELESDVFAFIDRIGPATRKFSKAISQDLQWWKALRVREMSGAEAARRRLLLRNEEKQDGASDDASEGNDDNDDDDGDNNGDDEFYSALVASSTTAPPSSSAAIGDDNEGDGDELRFSRRFKVHVDEQLIEMLANTSPEDVAKLMTIAEFESFEAIRPREFLAFVEDRRLAPNIAKFIDTFNRRSEWVCKTILRQRSVATRVHLISVFARVAAHCRVLRNYSSLLAISSAIYSNHVYELTDTLQQLPRDVKVTISALADLMSPRKGFHAYRKQIASDKAPCIPYVGLVLHDMMLIDEAIEDIVCGLINFRKREQLHQIVAALVDYRHVPYKFASSERLNNSPLLAQLRKPPSLSAEQVETFYRVAKQQNDLLSNSIK